MQSNNNNQLFKSEKKHRKKFKKFTVVEKALLKSEYEECQNPSIEEKERISDKYGLDKVSVNNWFKNMNKRKNMESPGLSLDLARVFNVIKVIILTNILLN